MIAISGRDAVMYELRPHKTPLGEMSPTRLIEAIRFAFGGANRLPDLGHSSNEPDLDGRE